MFIITTVLSVFLIIVPVLYCSNIIIAEYNYIKNSVEQGRRELSDLNIQLKSIRSMFSFFNKEEDTDKEEEEEDNDDNKYNNSSVPVIQAANTIQKPLVKNKITTDNDELISLSLQTKEKDDEKDETSLHQN